VIRRRFGGALDLLEVHSRLLGQPQKMNESALSQNGRIGPPSYWEQRTGVYDGLHKRKWEGGSARADTCRRAPSQTSTATPRKRSCKRCAVGMEASAIHPAYIGICGQTLNGWDTDTIEQDLLLRCSAHQVTSQATRQSPPPGKTSHWSWVHYT